MKRSRQQNISSLKRTLEQVIQFLEDNGLDGEAAQYPISIDQLPCEPIDFLQKQGLIEVFHNAQIRTDNQDEHTARKSDHTLFKHYMLIRENV